MGQLVATITGEVVSAQTVSKLTRSLDEAVKRFHQMPLADEWAYLFLDGVSLKVRWQIVISASHGCLVRFCLDAKRTTADEGLRER